MQGGTSESLDSSDDVDLDECVFVCATPPWAASNNQVGVGGGHGDGGGAEGGVDGDAPTPTPPPAPASALAFACATEAGRDSEQESQTSPSPLSLPEPQPALPAKSSPTITADDGPTTTAGDGPTATADAGAAPSGAALLFMHLVGPDGLNGMLCCEEPDDELHDDGEHRNGPLIVVQLGPLRESDVDLVELPTAVAKEENVMEQLLRAGEQLAVS